MSDKLFNGLSIDFTSMPNALYLPLVPLFALCTWAFVFYIPLYQRPEQIPFWTLLFGLPHIISSFQTMCDREYLVHYKTHVIVMSVMCVTPYGLHKMGVSTEFIMIAFTVATVHHVVAQQFGIALSVAGFRPTKLSFICMWSTIALGVAAFFYPYLMSDREHHSHILSIIDYLTSPALFTIAITGWMLVWSSRKNTNGAAMLAINIGLFVIALIIILKTQYVLVGLMLVRILHDVSGFVVYIKHDSSRNQVKRHNFLYRFIPILPIWLLNSLFAFTIAGSLSHLAESYNLFFWLVIGITFGHYFIERIIWRGKTPHRQHVSFSSS